MKNKSMSAKGGSASGGKIGIFDSGLGGLLIAKAIRKAMPEYDYVYLGDTKRVPYGNRSHDTVFEFSCEAVEYLTQKENCALIIFACNTASARALREVQKKYKNKKILGVLIPSAEEAAKFKRVGILATVGTVSSNTFQKEIKKINKKAIIFQNPAPMLVPLAEENELKKAKPFLAEYLKTFSNKNLGALVLGCTHYPLFKKEIGKKLPKSIKIISQDEIVPKKLKNYIQRHPEIDKRLSKKGSAKILVTDKTKSMEHLAKKWFGKSTKINLVKI